MNDTTPITNAKELEFAIFCIENVARELERDPVTVYDAMVQSEVLNGYIVPSYEALHTQGREYIVEDILDVMKERGAAV